jgi:two-component system, NtrC family, sensor histidine kinase HydH
MAETLFQELRRYVGFAAEDEQSLRALDGVVRPWFPAIAETFYTRILEHEGAHAVLGGESQVGHLKVSLVSWMELLLSGPWDEDYYQRRCRIGRVHVQVSLPQHYMFGAMNVLRQEFHRVIDTHSTLEPAPRQACRLALAKLLDLELAIMLHAYREDLLAQQARNERLSTFGQLVGSIGHELRNPLGVIQTSLYLLKGMPLADDERAAKHLNRIGEQVSLANHIVADLLDMIRDQPLKRERVRLEAVWKDALGAVRLPAGVRLHAEGLEALPSLEGDPVQLRQVLVNLLENAVYAVGETGSVRLMGSLSPEVVELVMEDSGPGVSEPIRRRLFEPLMTTKPRGIGLGLPLVKRILERHGGSILYAPHPGHGARFVMRLPLTPSSAPNLP